MNSITFNQPFRCDYGKNIRIGERFFANFNFTVLDEAYVTIGAGSVVTRDIPSRSVAVGNPARVIKNVAVAAACGYDLRNHHHALADVEAYARIAMEIL